MRVRDKKEPCPWLEIVFVRMNPCSEFCRRNKPCSSFLAELPRFENSRNVEMRTIELVAGKMFCYVLRDW